MKKVANEEQEEVAKRCKMSSLVLQTYAVQEHILKNIEIVIYIEILNRRKRIRTGEGGEDKGARQKKQIYLAKGEKADNRVCWGGDRGVKQRTNLFRDG